MHSFDPTDTIRYFFVVLLVVHVVVNMNLKQRDNNLEGRSTKIWFAIDCFAESLVLIDFLYPFNN